MLALVGLVGSGPGSAPPVRANAGGSADASTSIGHDPGECPRCRNYERARHVIEQEDALINQRLTWLFVGEGFTFAAFGVVVNAGVGTKPRPTLSLQPWAVHLVWALGIAGASAALATLIGLLGAFTAMNQTHQRWWAVTQGQRGAHTCGHENWFERLQGRRESLTLGGVPAFAFPILLTATWTVLLIGTTPWGQQPGRNLWVVALVLGGVSLAATIVMAFQVSRLGELARLGCTHHHWLRPLRARNALDAHRAEIAGGTSGITPDSDRPRPDYGARSCGTGRCLPPGDDDAAVWISGNGRRKRTCRDPSRLRAPSRRRTR
jgi:hypothetical protein